MKHIYVIRVGISKYKIGVATNVYNRIKSIQTSNGDSVQLITHKLVDNSSDVEKYFHRILKNYRMDGGTEWFKLTPQRALEVCAEIHKLPNVKATDLDIIESMALQQLEQQKKIASRLHDILDRINYEKKPTVIDDQLSIDRKLEASRTLAAEREKARLSEQNKLFMMCLDVVMNEGYASTSLLQRKLSIGYGRAARIMDTMFERKLISKADGNKPRQVIANNVLKFRETIIPGSI